MALYHRDVYLPEAVRSLSFAVMLRYSRHARDAARSDRYGTLPLPTALDTRDADLVEAEVVKDEPGEATRAPERAPEPVKALPTPKTPKTPRKPVNGASRASQAHTQARPRKAAPKTAEPATSKTSRSRWW